MTDEITITDANARHFLATLHGRLNQVRTQLEHAPYRHAVRLLSEIGDTEAELAELVGFDLTHFCGCGQPVCAEDDVIHFEGGPADPCITCSALYEEAAVKVATQLVLEGRSRGEILAELRDKHGQTRSAGWLDTVAGSIASAA